MTQDITQGRVDVLVVGAGPAGAVAAHTLAVEGFSVVCLEQGDWVNPTDLPGTKPEFELLTRGEWSVWPNERRGVADYPLNVDDADVDPIMFNAVGGGTVMFGAHWMRLLPSDFRVRTVDGVCDDWPIGYEDLEPYPPRGRSLHWCLRSRWSTPLILITTFRCLPIQSARVESRWRMG